MGIIDFLARARMKSNQVKEKVNESIDKIEQSKIVKTISKSFKNQRGRPTRGNPVQKIVYGNNSGRPRSSRGVGRPRGVYKNPANVPAAVWYKIQRQQRRLAQIRSQQISDAQIQAMARRGVPPQIAQQIQQQRMSPQPQQPQQPIQPQQPQQRSIWNRQGWVESDWGLFGRRQVVRGRPESFWN